MAAEISAGELVEVARRPDNRGEANQWLTAGKFAIILFLFICAAYPDVIFGRNTFYFRDFGYFGYPLAHYHRESIWRGELPLWNPLNNCGLPFLAQWNTMVLYPGSLFYLLFPLTWSLGAFGLAHLFLAGMGMYWLARRWTDDRFAAGVAGLAYACNGLTLNALMWPNNIAALGWMPLVVLLVERGWREGGRKLIGAGLVGATQMLTGAPEVIIFTWCLVAAVALGEWIAGDTARGTLCFRLGLTMALVGGLSAAQLLPFLDLLHYSQRSQAFANTDWSMPETGWANFLVPLFHTYQNRQGVFFQYGQYWTSSYYVGIAIVAFAIFASWRVRTMRVWLLAGVTLLSLVLALGDDGHLYGWLRKTIPQAGFMRFPIKFVVLAVFCFPILAAFGLREMERRSGRSVVDRNPRDGWAGRSSRTQDWRSLILIAGAMALLAGAVVIFGYFYRLPSEDWTTTWKSAGSRTALLGILLGTLYFAQRVEREKTKDLLRVMVLVLVGLDGLTHVPRQNPTVERGVFEPHLSTLQQLRPLPKHGESRAMITPDADMKLRYTFTSRPRSDYLVNRSGLFSNCNLLEDIPKLNGFYSLYLREADDVRNLLYAGTNGSLPALCDFLGVSQITRPGEYFEWTNRPTFMPMATVGQRPVFAQDAEALRILTTTNFHPREEVYLPAEAKLFVSAKGGADARVLSSRFRSQAAEIRIQADAPTLLVVAQAFYHPWKAYVDGRLSRIWRGNYAYQVVEVPAGTHEVRLAYEDRKFWWGAVVSGVSLAGCCFGWAATKRR